MNIFSRFTLCGGLAFFLYGMTVMSKSLEKMAGGKLERLLKRMTSNPIKSLLLGAGITIAIQSSSAMTVMLVGLVNSGVMEIGQTIGIIMGSNIGTTLTAWLLSLTGIESENFFVNFLKPKNFSPLLALIGILLIMGSKRQRRRDVGRVMMGFSILMYGMELMSGAVSPLADMPGFTHFMTAFTNPFLGVLVGAAFTGIIQSSAASVGILQALAMTGSVTYGIAIPIIMGQNIGTCVTALISSIGVSRNAKRVSVIHISFNLIGTALGLLALFGDQGGGGSNYFIVGIGGLFNILDALSIQIGLGVGNGLGRVGFRQGVQQADLCGVGILGEHHIHDEIGIQGVAGAGDIADPGQLGSLRVGDCGVDHRGLGLLGGEGGDLGGGGGDGDDGIHTVGNGLIAQLLENGLVALTGGDLVFDLHILIGGDLIQLRSDGVGDLVQRGVVQLLDDGDLVGLGVSFGGRGSVLVGRTVGGGFGLAAAGGQRQGHGTGKSQGQELLHHVVFHFGFLQKYKMFEWQMTVLAVPGPNGNKKTAFAPLMGQKLMLLRYHPN